MCIPEAMKKASTAKMDLANKAICYAMRNPPKGHPKMPYNKIKDLVFKTDGSKPKISAMSEAALNFKVQKGQRGRPEGRNKTTKEEDKVLMATFHKVRPPGHGVSSRIVHQALPHQIKKKISKRTCRRRLADKGYKPSRKLSKSDPGVQGLIRRLKFGRFYEEWTAPTWKSKLQGVADVKEFTFYPTELHDKFTRFRAPWTYMTKAEKKLPAFQRPKRWFPKSEYQKVKKQKVFGLTTSNGKSLAFLVPSPWNAEVWAGLVHSKVAPFLKRSFPTLTSYQILLDGEKIFYAPAAKKAFKEKNITILPHWPKYSPDLNPQENVWSWAEPRLRELETSRTSFTAWQQKCLEAVKEYPASDKLVGAMAKRVKLLIDKKGIMLPM
jgi:hypothetical protein